MDVIIGSLQSQTTSPHPRIEVYRPKGTSNHMGLIVFPGGGYQHLSDHEGKGYAEHFANHGFTCFVVSYRLGSQGARHPKMLEDGLAAVETVRLRAAEYDLDPDWIGVIGSSAGGHLAGHVSTSWQNYESPVSLRPAFGILCYPVVTFVESFGHQRSGQNLAGPEASPDLLRSLSIETLVSENAAPMFLWHTAEDQNVLWDNSIVLAQKLKAHDVPFELHVYQKGRHGLGLGTEFDWAKEAIRWVYSLCTSVD